MKKKITLRVSSPRGFCAGVDRAIQIVVAALKKYGKPVYVRHQIVHNKYVVDKLKERGAIFIEHLEDIPETDKNRPVVFSAHGVPLSVFQDAKNRNIMYLDATCPLVSKVHKQAIRHWRLGRHVLLIGHAAHPEVIGTMGQLPENSVTLIQHEEDIEQLHPENPDALGYVSQTTLSIADVECLIAKIRKRFPSLYAPTSESVCYATTNRQEAVKKISKDIDIFFIVGSPNSSNSKHLVEVAKSAGAKESMLIENVDHIPWSYIEKFSLFGLSVGASAPEILLHQTIHAFQKRFDVEVDFSCLTIEKENFPLLHELADVVLEKEDMAFLKG